MAAKYLQLYQKVVSKYHANLHPAAAKALDQIDRAEAKGDVQLPLLCKPARLALEQHIGLLQNRLAASEAPEEQESLSDLIEKLEILIKMVRKLAKTSGGGTSKKIPKAPPPPPGKGGKGKPKTDEDEDAKDEDDDKGKSKGKGNNDKDKDKDKGKGNDEDDEEDVKPLAKSQFVAKFQKLCKDYDVTVIPSFAKALDGMDKVRDNEALAKVAPTVEKACKEMTQTITTMVKKETDKDRKTELSKWGFDLRKMMQEIAKHLKSAEG